MNWAKQRHLSDAFDEAAGIDAPRRGGGAASGIVVIAVLMGALAAGLAYYALRLSSEQHVTRSRLKTAVGQSATLREQNAKTARELAAFAEQREERDGLLAEANGKLLELNTELAVVKTQLAETAEERAAIREQLTEFRQMTQQFRRMIDSGRLEVVFRRGRMIVQLPAQVLFPSGSAELTDDGRKSLSEVARILRGLRNRRFVVAGHTDNVPIARNEHFASNWELSSARAVNVTSALIRGGLRPEQLVAAGYSEYDPVARNTSDAGRQKNRRIEIILEPRLRDMPELAQAKPKAVKAKTGSAKSAAKP
jgi:chemotaxis protein MotB